MPAFKKIFNGPKKTSENDVSRGKFNREASRPEDAGPIGPLEGNTLYSVACSSKSHTQCVSTYGFDYNSFLNKFHFLFVFSKIAILLSGSCNR